MAKYRRSFVPDRTYFFTVVRGKPQLIFNSSIAVRLLHATFLNRFQRFLFYTDAYFIQINIIFQKLVHFIKMQLINKIRWLAFCVNMG